VSATRRGFLAGAVASAAAPALARSQSAPSIPGPEVRPRTVLRGRALAVSPRRDRVVVAHDRRRTIAIHAGDATQVVDVGGQPVEAAISPDGRLAAVTTGFWEKPGLAIVDLASGTVRTRIDVGPAPFGVAFASGGRRLLVSGGEQEGRVYVVDVARLAVVAQSPVGLVPRGVAVTPDGDSAWVALNGEDRIVRVSASTGRIQRSRTTPALPDRVAVSPDGRRLLVSHGGRNAQAVSEIAIATGRLTRHEAGRLPSAVAWSRTGARLIALGGSGEVLVIGRGGRRTLHRVGGAPRGLAVVGNRAWTVDALTGALRKVRL
jgi:DNA-binding beta-propeller fold protein YncE